MTVRAMDLFHIAVAIEVGVDKFLSFDDDQCLLAEESGQPLLQLPSRKR